MTAPLVAPIDYTARDYTALREAMLEVATQRLPEWSDHSANDLGVVLTELVAFAVDIQLYYQDRIANEGYLDTAVERRSLVRLLRLIGYELEPPKPASADLTLFFDPVAVGTVPVKPGARFESGVKVGGKPIGFEYVRPEIDIDLATLPTVTFEGKPYKAFDTLPVIQSEPKTKGEVLGSSDASPGQRFRLARGPLLKGQLTVTVDEGAGPHAWQVRDNLLASTATDDHCAVVRDVALDGSDVAWVEFGDGRNGRIPKRGVNNVVADYLVGGGQQGNVGAGKITQAKTAITSLKKVTNKAAATGGADAESALEAASRAPRQFRSWGRAVTADDYASHALRFGVGKARARAPGWNRIEVFVAPAGGGQPSDTLKDDLRAYFEDKRMLTSIVDILDPTYIPVFLTGELIVKPYFFTAQVQQQVQNAVREVFRFENVSFEDTIYLSEIYQTIGAIEGVEAIDITGFARPTDPAPLPPGGRMTFQWNEIPILGFPEAIQLTVTGGSHGD